jgi:hypothetical protein
MAIRPSECNGNNWLPWDFARFFYRLIPRNMRYFRRFRRSHESRWRKTRLFIFLPEKKSLTGVWLITTPDLSGEKLTHPPNLVTQTTLTPTTRDSQMSNRNALIIAIVVLGLGVSNSAYGQEQRQKSARKPTPARLQGNKPSSFHIHINPIHSGRRNASAMQQSDVRGGQIMANRTEQVNKDETLTVLKPKRVQPGNSGGTISNQRTKPDPQAKLGNFEIQGISECQQQLDWILGNYEVQGLSEADACWQYLSPSATPGPRTNPPKSIPSPRNN